MKYNKLTTFLNEYNYVTGKCVCDLISTMVPVKKEILEKFFKLLTLSYSLHLKKYVFKGI